MTADTADFKYADLAERTVGAALKVPGTLGYGFAEKVYENALAFELRVDGLEAVQQVPVDVRYKGQVVGEYVADVIVNEKVGGSPALW